jgi:uncharacterized protein YabN with tetrapyrrole methylase and pyrophosphatase domain
MIHIVGAGIEPQAHLSLESVAALNLCEEFWTNVASDAHSQLPGLLPMKVRSLRPFYLSDRPRIDSYRMIVEHIIERAKRYGNIGYLTQGNPIVFDSVTAGLLRARQLGILDVKIYPAISSLDTLLIDVLYDPAKGLQVHEATGFVLNRTVIDPRAALLLLQPSVFGSHMPRLSTKVSPDLLPLMEALYAYYPPEHPVKLVRTATGTMSPRIVECQLRNICEVDADATLGSTLFIPPLRFWQEKRHAETAGEESAAAKSGRMFAAGTTDGRSV